MSILLNNVSTDVTSPPAADIFVSKGGLAVINIRATAFGGATVEIQIASTNDILTRFATLSGGSFTADASITLNYLPLGVSVRAIVTGTTGPSDAIFADILQ